MLRPWQRWTALAVSGLLVGGLIGLVTRSRSTSRGGGASTVGSEDAEKSASTGPETRRAKAPRVLPIHRRPGGWTEFDLTAPAAQAGAAAIDLDEERDPIWAPAMEQALESYARKNLDELFPGSEWYGNECYATSCEMSFAIPIADAGAASDFPFLFSGVGIARQRDPERTVDGLVHYRFRIRVADPETQERTDPDDFSAMQRDFAGKHPERYENARAAVIAGRAR